MDLAGDEHTVCFEVVLSGLGNIASLPAGTVNSACMLGRSARCTKGVQPAQL